MRSKTRRKMWRIWRQKLRPIALTILVLTSFRSAIADWNDVPTGSMNPTIVEGDRIFVNKLAYGLKVPFTTWHLLRWGDPQRGEIVIFNSPVDGVRLVKRIVGGPGDTVAMRDNRLYINGQAVQYSSSTSGITEALGQTTHHLQFIPSAPSMRSFGPITVPPGHYFVMGDNRDNSNDSRFIGTISENEIVGRSSTVALSLDYAHHFLPRWERFFKSLD